MALVANIETREWRHRYNIDNSIPLEHPRASTTDDVECFFSILKDTVGKDFTLQEVNTCQPTKLFDNIVYLYLQVFYGWRWVTQEFLKRILVYPFITIHQPTHGFMRESCLNSTKSQLKNSA